MSFNYQGAIKREWVTDYKVSETGRTFVVFSCPFCDAKIKGYVWSLAGSGKRCYCGVMHRLTGSYWEK